MSSELNKFTASAALGVLASIHSESAKAPESVRKQMRPSEVDRLVLARVIECFAVSEAVSRLVPTTA